MPASAAPWRDREPSTASPSQAGVRLGVRLARALDHLLEEERERLLLWAPVALAVGIGIYFALPGEPGPFLLGALAALAVAAGIKALRMRTSRPAAALALGAAALMAAGLLLAKARTESVRAPVLERAGVYRLEGRLLLAEPRRGRVRLLLDRIRIEGLAPEATPARVRVTAPPLVVPLGGGERLALTARLAPPPAPSWPGAFDFARQAWFQQLGAIGFALGRPEVVAPPQARGPLARIASLRQALAARAQLLVGGEAGAVAAALLTGLRGGLSDELWARLQASGLAPLLAISGLHLGLVAGTLFLAARWTLALIPVLALRVPVKKLAAGFALAGALFYLLLSGAAIPTRRAFVMVALALFACMVDRNPFSMRLLALAATVVLAAAPEALVTVSFQISFAAAAALVAFFEPRRERRPAASLPTPLAYPKAVLTTTLVAGTATLPFAAWHFQHVASYGLLANLLAVPLTAFWILPAGLLALLAWPFGLDPPFFAAMGAGIRLLLGIAETVSDLPGAGLRVPRPPASALLLYVAGGLWLVLWQGRRRLWGWAPILLASALAATARPPDVLVSPWADQIAVRTSEGAMALLERRRDRFLRQSWRRALAAERILPFAEAGASADLACDRMGCLLRREGAALAVALTAEALLEDCGRVQLVVTPLRGASCPGSCFLDGPVLARTGGVALWLGEGAIRIDTVAERRGRRPWTRGGEG